MASSSAWVLKISSLMWRSHSSTMPWFCCSWQLSHPRSHSVRKQYCFTPHRNGVFQVHSSGLDRYAPPILAIFRCTNISPLSVVYIHWLATRLSRSQSTNNRVFGPKIRFSSKYSGSLNFLLNANFLFPIISFHMICPCVFILVISQYFHLTYFFEMYFQYFWFWRML